MAKPMLAWRLYNHPDGRKRFVAALAEVMKKHWQEQALQPEVDRMEQLIGAVATAYPYERGSSGKKANFKGAVAKVRAFIKGRRALVQPLLDNPPSKWGKAPTAGCNGGKKGVSYFATGTFNTTFGSMQTKEPLTTGTATVKLSAAGKTAKVGKAGATSGVDAKSKGSRALQVHVQELTSKGSRHLVVHLLVPEKAFAPGSKLTLGKDATALQGVVLLVDAKSGGVGVAGYLGDATLTLDKAGTDSGDAVAGSFTAKWQAGGK